LLANGRFVALVVFENAPGQPFTDCRGKRLKQFGGEFLLLIK
jgi:hypothetical protein